MFDMKDLHEDEIELMSRAADDLKGLIVKYKDPKDLLLVMAAMLASLLAVGASTPEEMAECELLIRKMPLGTLGGAFLEARRQATTSQNAQAN